MVRSRKSLSHFCKYSPDAYTKCAQINKKIIPAFYRYLQAQDSDARTENALELKQAIDKLVSVADSTGPFFLGPEMGFVDVQVAPWFLRLRRVLKVYRGWPDPELGSRFAVWLDAIEGNLDVKATTSTDDLYVDSYERYAGTFFLLLSIGDPRRAPSPWLNKLMG